MESEDGGGQPEGEAGMAEAGPKELRIEGSAACAETEWRDGSMPRRRPCPMVCNRLAAYSFVMPMPGDQGGTIGFDMIRSHADTPSPRESMLSVQPGR